jgi:hypothetical protein
LCPGHAELARLLIRIGPQQAAYIIDQKGKFSLRTARAHGFPCIVVQGTK